MDIQLFEYHPIIGYHFIPGLKARLDHEGGGYLVRVNEAGFRSEHEYVREKGDKFRILLFGDSFTAADSVSNKHRYGDVLETLIPGVEVYNFALPGTGSDQHYLTYREFAREYEHDLVIIAVQVENIRRVVAHYRLSIMASGEHVLFAKPYYELAADGSLILCNIPVPKSPINAADVPEDDRDFIDEGGRMLWLRQMVNKMGAPVKDLAQKISRYQPLPEYDRADGHEWTLMKAILRQWVGELEKPVIVMPIPIYHYVEETASPENYRARFNELKDWPGVTVHDPLPDYAAVPKAERRAFRLEKDIHPTPAHHRLLAESLARSVRAFTTRSAEGAAAK
jgi:carbamoyltransferase